MTIAHQSSSSSEASAPDRTTAPVTTPTRHRTRPARKDPSPPPALSIHSESKLRDTEEFSPLAPQALKASYHSSNTQDSSLKSPSASAKSRYSTRLSLSAQTPSLGSSVPRQTKALRKATLKSSDQDQSSANCDRDNSTVRRVSTPVSKSPFLVADEDNHNNSNHDKDKAALFWTRHQNKELQGLHADTPTKSRIRQQMVDLAPRVRRWTRSQALEADLRRKQDASLQSDAKWSEAAAGGSERDDGADGDDEGSEGSDTQTFTDGDESPLPRTPSKTAVTVAKLDNPPRQSRADDPFKDDFASQHILRMRILGAHARTHPNPTSFKRRVAAVTGSGTDEDNDPYEQECSDGDKIPIPRTPSKRMKQASSLKGLEARSPSSPGSWLERWKLDTMMNHSSMKPPKAPQDDTDPTEILPAVEPSGALGFATPKRKRTVFLDDMDLAPSRSTIDGHTQGDEECEGTEEERNGSEDIVAGNDVRTPVKTRPLRLDLAELSDLQTVSDQQQSTTADFQTPPHKQVRKDLFGQNMRPPPAPRGLSLGHQPMYFENMGTSSPIAQKTLHLHRPPSEW